MANIPVFNYTKHKELWQWLSEHPEEDKEAAFAALAFSVKASSVPYAHCYACQACKELILARHYDMSIALNCTLCPLEWPGGECEFSNSSGIGLYWQWTDQDATASKRADLARQIRDLPIKPNWPGKII